MPGRYHTKAEKDAAVAKAAIDGPQRASEALGIPRASISRWLNEPQYAELVAKSRDEVVGGFWAALQVALASVVESFDGKASLRDKAIALGILYDKHALLTGGATNRSESRDISGTLSDSELLEAVREAERITSERGTPAPTPSETEG